MFYTVFHFQGRDFKANKTPESFEHLMQAAHSIAKQHRMLKGAQKLDFIISFITL